MPFSPANKTTISLKSGLFLKLRSIPSRVSLVEPVREFHLLAGETRADPRGLVLTGGKSGPQRWPGTPSGAERAKRFGRGEGAAAQIKKDEAEARARREAVR